MLWNFGGLLQVLKLVIDTVETQIANLVYNEIISVRNNYKSWNLKLRWFWYVLYNDFIIKYNSM